MIMIGTSHEFVPNNTIQGREKKEVVNKSVANYSNKTETKLHIKTLLGFI